MMMIIDDDINSKISNQIKSNHKYDRNPSQGEFGDTRLWELLEQLNLRDLVAVGGLEAMVQNDDDVHGDEEDCYDDDYDDVPTFIPFSISSLAVNLTAKSNLRDLIKVLKPRTRYSQYT